MTAAGKGREAERLRSLWIPTLGDTAADPEWRALAPGATYKPAGTTELDVAGSIPRTVREATLSGLGTLGGTLSGRETAAESTLSGRGTLGAEPTKARARSKGTELPGLELPGFELTEEIGRGGMGIVFRAHQRSLARDIAIKLVRPEAARATTRSQFVAEALVNGLLDHPNIVPVHELGTSTQGEVYLAMKLVGGTSWKNLLHPASAAHEQLAGEYDLDRHLAILQSVANALAFAHSKGIVHRDLKPENVMVGAFGEVLVMDWGIAVDVRERPGEDARARHKSTIRAPSGTPSYMPPELAEGKGSDIGPWTDTYLLGAILHELLTGHPPHRGETLLAVLLAASQSAPPVFPRGTPPGLAAICSKALAKSPKDRYGTVAELQAALRDYVKHRESEKIAESAALALARAEQAGAADEAARTRRYADFAEAIAGFRQALALWDANATARAGEGRARREYAETALAAGDLGLADEQARTLEGGDELRARIQTARAAVAARARSAKRNRRLLASAAGVIVVGSIVATLWINSERGKAVVAQKNAENEKAIAESEKQRAESEKTRAEIEKANAETARTLAETEKTRAENEKTRAEHASAETRRQLVQAVHRQAVQAQERGDDSSATILFARALELSESDGSRDALRRAALQNSLSHLAALETVYELDANPVLCTPNGRRLLVSSERGLRVWDGMEGRPLGDWVATDMAHFSLRFMSQNRAFTWVNDAGEEYDGRMFDVEQGRWAGPALDLAAEVSVADVGNEGSLLVQLGPHRFRRYSVDGEPTGMEVVLELAPDEGEWTERLARLSPDGRRAVIVVAPESNQLFRMLVVSLENGRAVCEGPGHTQESDIAEILLVPATVVWSPDGKLVASISASCARTWDAESGEPTGYSIGGDAETLMNSVHWVTNDQIGGFDDKHRLLLPKWSGVDEIALGETSDPVAEPFALAVAAGHGIVAMGTDERELQVWVLGQPARRACAPISLSEALKFAAIEPAELPDGSSGVRVLAVGRDGIAKVALVDAVAERGLAGERIGEAPLYGDALAPDGEHVFFRADGDAPLAFAPLASPESAVELEDAQGVAAWSSRLDRLAAGTLEGTRLFAFPSGATLGPTVARESDDDFATEFEHEGRMLVMLREHAPWTEPGPARLFALESGASVEDERALTFALQLEGRLYSHATPGQTHSISGYGRSVDLVARHLAQPRVFPSPVELIAGSDITCDGSRFLTRSEGGIVRILSTENGRELCPPLCEGDPLERNDRRGASSARFCPTAPVVVTTDAFGVRLWDAESGLSLARVHFKGAEDAWVNAELALVVAYGYEQGSEEWASGLFIGRLPLFEGDPRALQASLSVRLDREWNGQSVRRLEWREVLGRALELSGSEPGFHILHVQPPSDESWQIEVLAPSEAG